MKIRIEGTNHEVNQFLEDMKHFYELEDVSKFYPNRGKTEEGRVYANVKMQYTDEDGSVDAL